MSEAVKVTVMLSSEDVEYIQALAKVEGTTASDLIREGIAWLRLDRGTKSEGGQMLKKNRKGRLFQVEMIRP